MVVRQIIKQVMPGMWPLITFVCVIAISLRLAYLKGSKRFVFHKELLSLVFIIYILSLYCIVTASDVGAGGVNLVPFKEIFRYQIGSYKFMKNVVGNILLFLPYGYFSSYFLNNKKVSTNVIITLIATLSIESIQYYIGRSFDIDDIILNVCGGFLGYLLFVALSAVKSKLPRFMRSDGFMNFIVLLIIVLCIVYGYKMNLFGLL